MRRKNVLPISVTLGGETVTSRLSISDWSVEQLGANTSTPFAARHLRPDTAALELRVRQLFRDAPHDPRSRRAFARHVLGIALNPDGVLTSRVLTTRQVADALAGVRASFDRLVHGYVMKTQDARELEGELCELLAGIPYPEMAERWNEVSEMEDELVQIVMPALGKLYATCRANGERYLRTSTALERNELHRVRQVILRRCRHDKRMLRTLAFRYICEGDALVDEVNREILAALRPQVSLADAQLFEFLYLRRRAQGRAPRFTGILGYQSTVMSMIEQSSNTLGMLVAACHQQRPLRGSTSRGIDLAFRRQFVGAIRATKYILGTVLDAEREQQRTRRARRPRSERSSRSTARAAALRPSLEHLTDYQRTIVERLASGMTVSEVARDTDQSHQAVQSALRRSEERIRAISRP